MAPKGYKQFVFPLLAGEFGKGEGGRGLYEY